MLGLETAVYLIFSWIKHLFRSRLYECPEDLSRTFCPVVPRGTNQHFNSSSLCFENTQGIMKPPPEPESDTHVLIQQFWVEAGELERIDPEGKRYFSFHEISALKRDTTWQ